MPLVMSHVAWAAEQPYRMDGPRRVGRPPPGWRWGYSTRQARRGGRTLSESVAYGEMNTPGARAARHSIAYQNEDIFMRMAGSFSGKWVGAKSMRHFRRASWNMDRAISGKGIGPAPGRTRVWSAGGRVGLRAERALSSTQRVHHLGRAGDHLLMALRKLPGRTKLAAPVVGFGAWAFMRRGKQDKFYTHYYDF